MMHWLTSHCIKKPAKLFFFNEIELPVLKLCQCNQQNFFSFFSVNPSKKMYCYAIFHEGSYKPLYRQTYPGKINTIKGIVNIPHKGDTEPLDMCTNQNGQKRTKSGTCQMSGVTYQVSHVRYQVSHVTCHKDQVKNPPPAKSPIPQIRLDPKDSKTQKKYLTTKHHQNIKTQ